MDGKTSWTRLAITLVVDWRFVVAVVILVLTLPLLRQQNPREGRILPGHLHFNKSARVRCSLVNALRQQCRRGGASLLLRDLTQRPRRRIAAINRDVEAGLVKLLLHIDLSRRLQRQQVRAHPGNL